MGYIYARLIHRGARTIEEVPAKYVDVTKAAYLDLYGEELV